MKYQTILIINFIVFFLASPLAFSKGQEVGGGDLYSIMFVKIGRLLLQEMKTNPQCHLKDSLSVATFEHRLADVTVETGSSVYAKGDHYILDRMDWIFRPIPEKAKIVLSLYSGQDFRTMSWHELSTCQKSADWGKVDIAGMFTAKPHIDLALDASQVSVKLLDALNSPIVQSFYQFVDRSKLTD